MIKKAYMQALRLVHPDKLPANAVRSPWWPSVAPLLTIRFVVSSVCQAVRDEVQATKIFTRLQTAYEEFKQSPF